jgi:hypothetical protein
MHRLVENAKRKCPVEEEDDGELYHVYQEHPEKRR